MKRTFSLWLVMVMLSGVVLTGCGGGETAVPHKYSLAPLAEMSTDVQHASPRIQEAYQFAVANPEVAAEIPCYCGCNGMGHTSLYACYVAGVDETGAVQFDKHAQYCTICIDITHDAMRMMDEGKSTADIFIQIEADYARFGPPTIKPQTGASS